MSIQIENIPLTIQPRQEPRPAPRPDREPAPQPRPEPRPEEGDRFILPDSYRCRGKWVTPPPECR